MITPHSFTKQWIEGIRKKQKTGKVNPPVFEKMIFAFALLEKLAKNGLDFIFKGGTSLVLLLSDFRRFSTDIDIITLQTEEELRAVLENIVQSSVFTAYKKDEKRSSNQSIPKSHYNISFPSNYNQEGTITLDVIFDTHPYPEIIEKEIRTAWFETEKPFIKVKLPNVDSILGDKLTAFAPHTTGIPYFRNETSMSIEIIKQLFDIGTLIDHVKNPETVFKSFINSVNKQQSYFNLNLNINHVFDDIFNTSLIIAKRERNVTEQDKTYFSYLKDGIRGFNQYLSEGNFRIEEAVSAAGKVAFFTSLMRTEKFEKFGLYPTTDLPDQPEIVNTNYNFLNRLKKTNREAFYYWCHALELLNLSE
ncbi:MAG: nucleotidyl transferase AbiEii/AbiGii toxin family protein [Bacteroidota bacterium]